jgi:hypothetical protein
MGFVAALTFLLNYNGVRRSAYQVTGRHIYLAA